jgi:L-amino acid N-acyltransferase YncA
MRRAGDAAVTLERWGEGDLPVLEAANTPEMTAFLGGPETAEQLAKRHERYLRLCPFQGRGIATRALRACVEYAAAHGDRDTVVAFPRIDNTASNALCRKVGFRLAGEEDGEYPPGNRIRVHPWVFDLSAPQ